MASKPLFKGNVCKQSCAGHRAGFNYARSGGTKFTPSTSFNTGMKVAMGQLPKRKKK